MLAGIRRIVPGLGASFNIHMPTTGQSTFTGILQMPKKLETWQIWHALKKALGETFLMAVMGKKNARTIRLYSQDPRTTEDRCKDPLEALHIIFSEADLIGRGDLARKAIDYLHTSLDDDGGYDATEASGLLPTMAEEKLAYYVKLAAFQKAIEDGADVDLVEVLMNEAKSEIERTYAKYLRG